MPLNFASSDEFDPIFRAAYERRSEGHPTEGYEGRKAYTDGYIDAWNDALRAIEGALTK